nr:hypothetical protein [Tanacetum cinerariifolium]
MVRRLLRPTDPQMDPVKRQKKCFPVKLRNSLVKPGIISSSTHPIILNNSDIEDAFSLKNISNYTPASPNYSSALPGNTFSDASQDPSEDQLVSIAVSPFHDDPYMKVMQAYYATNELPILPPPALIAPPPSLVLSPQFDPRYLFLPKEILPPQKQTRFLSHSFADLFAPP